MNNLTTLETEQDHLGRLTCNMKFCIPGSLHRKICIADKTTPGKK